MYSDENIRNKWLKSDEHSGRAETDLKYELLKYKTIFFTTPKLMRLNEDKLQGVSKVFQVFSSLYPK